ENRSAERFGQAMRVLSRKEQDDAEETFEKSAAPVGAAARPRRPQQRPRPQRTLAQRRARTLAVLGSALVVLTLAAVLTPVPWWAPLPVAALVVAFVVHLRVQAIQHERRRSGARRPARPGDAQTKTGRTEESRHERAPGQPARVEQQSASSFVSGPSRAVVVETKGSSSVADVTFDEGDEETWRPNPLPLPTYVTAPKAIRPIKVIDLTTPGAWTSGRLLDDDFAAEDLLAAEVASDELDALLEQEVAPPPADQGHDEASRRAVGD
ncbi:MAG TPA: hypothetical protein VMX11_05570, partial [Actinomycetes bacterium]|nr:hypothetical protein [Actinomycetes bacterium]